ncbi:hypothetical protein O6H91_22G023600 [Diphasiastrum complanatum]|nr:hypothetical protein O6H91_22G023600 [Diphasiastrum complanatum]
MQNKLATPWASHTTITTPPILNALSPLLLHHLHHLPSHFDSVYGSFAAHKRPLSTQQEPASCHRSRLHHCSSCVIPPGMYRPYMKLQKAASSFCHVCLHSPNKRYAVDAAAAKLRGRELHVVAEDTLDQMQVTSAEAEGEGGGGGPIQLPREVDPFEIPEASPIQLVGSVILTGAIAVLLYRSLRRRAQRAKELKLRSSGIESASTQILKDTQGVSIQNLKAPEVKTPPPSFRQTFFGALLGGAMAYVLYKFTVTVEGSFADKSLSANYSIRNLTITIRTIINGLLYLATFVFAANSIGLTLYSLQLLFSTLETPDADKNVKILSDEDMAESQDGTGDKSGQP